MNRILAAAAALGLASALGACTNPDGTRDNRMTGATLGAVGGGLLGNTLGGDSRATLIGAAGGAATGAVVGGAQDRHNRGF